VPNSIPEIKKEKKGTMTKLKFAVERLTIGAGEYKPVEMSLVPSDTVLLEVDVALATKTADGVLVTIPGLRAMVVSIYGKILQGVHDVEGGAKTSVAEPAEDEDEEDDNLSLDDEEEEKPAKAVKKAVKKDEDEEDEEEEEEKPAKSLKKVKDDEDDEEEEDEEDDEEEEEEEKPAKKAKPEKKGAKSKADDEDEDFDLDKFLED